MQFGLCRMLPSSRTPEGASHRCPVCGAAVRIEPSSGSRDAPCPCCGHLLWFFSKPRLQRSRHSVSPASQPVAGASRRTLRLPRTTMRERLLEWLAVACLLVSAGNLLVAAIIWSPLEHSGLDEVFGAVGIALMIAAFAFGILCQRIGLTRRCS